MMAMVAQQDRPIQSHTLEYGMREILYWRPYLSFFTIAPPSHHRYAHDPLKTTPERVEEWIASQEPVLRGRLSKAIQSFVAIVGPLLICLSGMPTSQKVTASVIYFLLMLCLWLLSWLAIYRTKVRQLKAEIAKESLIPPLPALTAADNSLLIHLVAEHHACSLDRIASYRNKPIHEIAFSIDKLTAHGFVQEAGTAYDSAGFHATARGRAYCMGGTKQQ